MKSYNNLYEPMLQRENVQKCFRDAAKGKTGRNDVQRTLKNLDRETDILCVMLEKEMFIPDSHRQTIINENTCRKVRRILKPNYRYEQVVHHLVIGQFKKIVLNGLYEFSCGSIPGRGVHYGKKYMKKWIASYQGRKMYVLKMDIHHFFESIDRKILKHRLREVIRDNRFYRLMCILVEHDRIADTVERMTASGIEMSEDDARLLVTQIAFNKEDDALKLLHSAGASGETFRYLNEIIRSDRKGVPLGYYTSQWFGNFYLKRLDHFIKQRLGADHYIRYMDDMVILGKNKRKLHGIRRIIEEYSHAELGLELKNDWQVFRFEYIGKDGKVRGRMIDFMGFQFHGDRITMRKSVIQRARRKALRIAGKDRTSWYAATQMLSYMGWFAHTDTYDFYIRHIKQNINVKKLKRIVSKHQRKENEQNERLEKGNRNTDGTSKRGRHGIITDDSLHAAQYRTDREEAGKRRRKSERVAV